MKKLIYLLSITITLTSLFFVSCEKDKENDIDSQIENLDDNDYFPLQLGNYWLLDYLPKRMIDKEENLDGENYYRLTSEYDTVFYRKTSEGKIYSRTLSGNEVLKFDLNAEINETWTYKYDNSQYTWNATLTSKSDTIKLDNYTFTNCYRFFFDVPQMADEEHVIWLAPGIGFVEEEYWGGTPDRKKLKNVKIDDVKIQF